MLGPLTLRATTMKTRQLNCLVSRRLPIYDGAGFSGAFDADGRHVAGPAAGAAQWERLRAQLQEELREFTALAHGLTTAEARSRNS